MVPDHRMCPITATHVRVRFQLPFVHARVCACARVCMCRYPDSSGLELFKPEDQWSSYDGSDDLVDLLATVQSDAQKHRLRGSHQQS